jgi:RNA polymerase sigma-70 factor (ECF subfamily)
VQKAQAGDLEAFEVLVGRHGKRVYRTLVGLLGSSEEARDAMQDTFLKVFQHLAGFQGRSKFSTWLISIAGNTGLQRLRERRPMESLDDDGREGDEGFRPRQVRAWTDDPEQLYSQAEVRSLVENCLKKLPAKYRVVVLLRDFEQLSAEDAAAALGLGVPALKSRLLRGRLMLRGAGAPFCEEAIGGRCVINCADFLAELGNYMDENVAEEVRLQLESHLSHCQTCQVILDSTCKTVRIVTDSGSFDLADAALKPMAAQIIAKIRGEQG